MEIRASWEAAYIPRDIIPLRQGPRSRRTGARHRPPVSVLSGPSSPMPAPPVPLGRPRRQRKVARHTVFGGTDSSSLSSSPSKTPFHAEGDSQAAAISGFSRTHRVVSGKMTQNQEERRGVLQTPGAAVGFCPSFVWWRCKSLLSLCLILTSFHSIT